MGVAAEWPREAARAAEAGSATPGRGKTSGARYTARPPGGTSATTRGGAGRRRLGESALRRGASGLEERSFADGGVRC